MISLNILERALQDEYLSCQVMGRRPLPSSVALATAGMCTRAEGHPDSRTDILASPFCHFSLTGSRPKSSAYPPELKTIGDHIRKRRLDLGLFQKDVAKIVGVDETTVFNWEHADMIPRLTAIPKIIEFLGYNPLITGETFGERLRLQRVTLGLTQKEVAQKMGIDPSTLASWERGEHRPILRLLDSVKAFVNATRETS
jgi:transcriptional regulator with XRE-family HTH domain